MRHASSWLIVLLSGLFIVVGMALLTAAVVAWAYNLALPPWLGWPTMTFREAFGLVVLFTIVAGFIAGPGSVRRKQ